MEHILDCLCNLTLIYICMNYDRSSKLNKILINIIIGLNMVGLILGFLNLILQLIQFSCI